MIKENDYITILAPMVTRLKLSGNNLLIFALIHGFTKDEERFFNGSISYISQWLNISKNSVVDTLKVLVSANYLTKKEEYKNGVKFCHYKSNMNDLISKLDSGCDIALPIAKTRGGIPKSQHNINIDIDNIKEDTIVSKKGKVFFDVRNDLSYVDAEYYTIWNEWLDYKDEIKKQYKTQRGATMQYHSLIKYSEDNPILANAIVKRSIEQSWDGFFALSQKQKDLFMSKKSPYIDKDSYITNRVEDMQKEIDKKRLIIEGKEYR